MKVQQISTSVADRRDDVSESVPPDEETQNPMSEHTQTTKPMVPNFVVGYWNASDNDAAKHGDRHLTGDGSQIFDNQTSYSNEDEIEKEVHGIHLSDAEFDISMGTTPVAGSTFEANAEGLASLGSIGTDFMSAQEDFEEISAVSRAESDGSLKPPAVTSIDDEVQQKVADLYDAENGSDPWVEISQEATKLHLASCNGMHDEEKLSDKRTETRTESTIECDENGRQDDSAIHTKEAIQAGSESSSVRSDASLTSTDISDSGLIFGVETDTALSQQERVANSVAGTNT